MPKITQNIVFFMEPSENAYTTPLKGGNMILNRFCIDEDAAFELSGVNSLKKSFADVEHRVSLMLELKTRNKGKEYFSDDLTFLKTLFAWTVYNSPKKNILIRK